MPSRPPKHTPGKRSEKRTTSEQWRPSASERGYTSRWDKARKGFLRSHATCVHCLAVGKVTEATVVDHIVPHCGDQGLFWNYDNWQALCARCHNIKTVKDDGGFGNTKRIR